MQVNGALVPPPEPLEEVAAVVRSVRRPVEAEPPKRGLLGRRSAERQPENPPAPVLLDVPVETMHLPVTGFGNLTTSDAHRLKDAIATAAAGWTIPTVWFAGGAALEFPGDWSVWAKLDGDLDALGTIARGVTASVELLGFFVDRRVFRPMLSVATVTESTTGPDLEAVVGALDAFRGQPWTVDSVVLTTDSFAGGPPGLREFARVQVGG